MFTAEIAAIADALSAADEAPSQMPIGTLPDANLPIFSDSRSALQTLETFNNCHRIVSSILGFLYVYFPGTRMFVILGSGSL